MCVSVHQGCVCHQCTCPWKLHLGHSLPQREKSCSHNCSVGAHEEESPSTVPPFAAWQENPPRKCLWQLQSLEGFNCPGRLMLGMGALLLLSGVTFCPCMWHPCQENSVASGAFSYPGILALWLKEGDIQTCIGNLTVQLWARTPPLWVSVCVL